MTDKINNVTSAAVLEATGKGWDDWIRFIDRCGGGKMDHKQIVALLAGKGGIERPWWQQMVTVGYEHAKGRRKTGETADAGYQIGVQKTIPLGRTALWRLLTSDAGVAIWLGRASGLVLEPGATFRVRGGPEVEIRTVRKGERLRMTLSSGTRGSTTTLQLTLSCPRNVRGRTTLRFHHEKLASKAERERMKTHWKRVADEILELVGSSGG